MVSISGRELAYSVRGFVNVLHLSSDHIFNLPGDVLFNVNGTYYFFDDDSEFELTDASFRAVALFIFN